MLKRQALDSEKEHLSSRAAVMINYQNQVNTKSQALSKRPSIRAPGATIKESLLAQEGVPLRTCTLKSIKSKISHFLDLAPTIRSRSPLRRTKTCPSRCCLAFPKKARCRHKETKTCLALAHIRIMKCYRVAGAMSYQRLKMPASPSLRNLWGVGIGSLDRPSLGMSRDLDLTRQEISLSQIDLRSFMTWNFIRMSAIFDSMTKVKSSCLVHKPTIYHLTLVTYSIWRHLHSQLRISTIFQSRATKTIKEQVI